MIVRKMTERSSGQSRGGVEVKGTGNDTKDGRFADKKRSYLIMAL